MMPYSNTKHLDLDQVIEWVEDPDLTINEVAKRCNVTTRHSVYNFLSRHGYEVVRYRKVVKI